MGIPNLYNLQNCMAKSLVKTSVAFIHPTIGNRPRIVVIVVCGGYTAHEVARRWFFPNYITTSASIGWSSYNHHTDWWDQNYYRSQERFVKAHFVAPHRFWRKLETSSKHLSCILDRTAFLLVRRQTKQKSTRILGPYWLNLTFCSLTVSVGKICREAKFTDKWIFHGSPQGFNLV